MENATHDGGRWMLDASGLTERLRRGNEDGRVFAELADGPLTYSQLWAQVRQILGYLDGNALSPSERFLIVTRSDRHAIELFLAGLLDGHCPALLPAETPEARLEAIVRKLRPNRIFIDADLKLALPWLKDWNTLAIGTAPANPSGALGRLLRERSAAAASYPAVVKQSQPRDPRPPSDPESMAFIAFTSGTTAAPKGVVASHRNLFDHLGTLIRRFGYDSHSRLLNNMVLSHNDGLVQGPLLALACGGALLRSRPLDARNIGKLFDDVYALKATHFITVPTVLAIGASRAEHDDYFSGAEFRHLISVAAKLDPGVWRKAEARFNTRISNIYGLTETIAGGLYCGPEDASHEIGTVGMPDDMDAIIVNEQGAEVAAGVVGELWLRGTNVVAGYWEDPEATAALRVGEWLRTGDLARLRSDGKFEICGRLKSLVVSGGFSVHPDEVDEVLMSHDDVAEAASLGIPHAEWGEVLVSVVVASPATDASRLAEFCRARLEPKKVPSRILIVDKLPRGRSGKVDRHELAELVSRELSETQGMASAGSVASTLSDLAASVFNIPAAGIGMQDGPDTIEGWDSLNHLQLVSAVERSFGIELGMAEVMRVQTLGDLLDVIESKRRAG